MNIQQRKREIIERAIDVLEDPDNAIRWLNSPVVSLGGRRPIDLWGTDEGAQMVMDVLGRIEYGVY